MILVIAIATLPCAARAQAPGEVTLVENGSPLGAIFVEAPIYEPRVIDAALHARHMNRPLEIDGRKQTLDAAALARSVTVWELNHHFAAMSGVRLPVRAVGSVGEVDGPGIVIGALANALGAKPDLKTASGEAFRLVASGNRLLIGGETDVAARHGAYEALRKLGVDWVMPGAIGQSVPQLDTIAFAEMDETHAPDFQYRRLWYRGFRPRTAEEMARFRQWIWRQKGGGLRDASAGAAGHVWQKFIERHQAAFDADPSMLALVYDESGQPTRRGPQLETTHPRVIELFAEDIRTTYAERIAAGVWTAQTEASFAIGPADGLDFSRSADALAAGAGRSDPIVGTPDTTDALVLFANEILARVINDYPNARVGYYSYANHADFPARHQPHGNVIQIFAPINFSRYHAVTDPISKTQGFYRGVVEQWVDLSRAQGNVLAFRGYNWNLADNMLPYTKVAIWGEELPYYHGLGFRSLDVEATKQWSVLAPSDYVFMRLAWDSSLDWRALLSEFSAAAYGAGARPMERYWLRLIETQRDAGMEAGSYHAAPLIFNADWVALAEADIAEALALAETDGDRARIGHVAIGVEFLRLYLAYHSATLMFDFDEAARQLAALQVHWEQAYAQNSDLVASEVPGYLDRFLGGFVGEAARLTHPPFSLVRRLPDALPTAFDPYVAGTRLGLYRPEIRDDHFIETRTISSTWDAQGLGGLRDGAVWYRWTVSLDAEELSEGIGLFLGGVEDTARVWANGTLAGGAGPAFSTPMVFDLTDHLIEGENLIAIQVVRNGKANEIGLGGILRPSFLFQGPMRQAGTIAPPG
ncbi:MAG: DUF4838 domain-containing protein [Pseudomonadota bacterium]